MEDPTKGATGVIGGHSHSSAVEPFVNATFIIAIVKFDENYSHHTPFLFIAGDMMNNWLALWYGVFTPYTYLNHGTVFARVSDVANRGLAKFLKLVITG